MMRIVSDLTALVGQLVPPWALPFALVGIALLAMPPWLESVRSKQINGFVRRMIRAGRTERDALADRVLHIAGQRRARLIGLALAAMRYDQRDLRDAALSRLDRLPKGRVDAARLRERFEKAPVRFSDPLTAQVRVERLLRAGLTVGAAEQLEVARRQFPDDPDLARLAGELATASDAVSEDA